jgi:hypothetical protein
MTQFYVAREGGWWIVRREKEQLGLFSHQEHAESAARKWAAGAEDSVVVLDQSGREVERDG